MDELNDNHLEQVTALFKRFGAEGSRADVMASQLVKRAGQIAKERNISELEALETLLNKVIEARQGL